MLTNDTAANDNKTSAITEQKISSQEHFQPKDEQNRCIHIFDANGKSVYENALPGAVMGLIDKK